MIGYHYTSQEGFKNIIKEDGIHLWFTDARFLNDALELEECNILFKTIVEEMYSKDEISDSLYEIIKDLRASFTGIKFCDAEVAPNHTECGASYTISVKMESFKKEFFVCCFSKEKDSLPMWNYYLKNSDNGYAIGIDLDKIDLTKCHIKDCEAPTSCFRLDKERIELIYDRSSKEFKLKDIIKGINDNMSKDDIEKAVLKSLSDLSLSFKDEHFEYEHEVRLFVESKFETDSMEALKYRFGYGLTIPYIEVIISDKTLLKAVSVSPQIGLNTDNGLLVEELRKYLSRLGYKHYVDLLCSEIPLRYY